MRGDPDPEGFRHVFALQPDNSSGRLVAGHGIDNDQVVPVLDVPEQLNAGSATIQEFYVI